MNLSAFFRNVWADLEIKKSKIELLWSFVAGSLLAFSLALHAGFLYTYSAPRFILQAFDDDTSYGVETTLKANWINHNSSTLYGPLYYRLATPGVYALKDSLSDESLSPQENIEKNTHFILMLINLSALYLASFLLLKNLTPSWPWALGGTVLLSETFLQNKYRSEILLMAKPDLLLALIVVIAVMYTWKWLENPSEKSLRSMTFTWSLASLTKLLTIFFIPSFLLLFLQGEKNKFTKNLKYFFKWTLIFYFGIGIFQTWDIYGYLKYLLNQNSHTSLVSWEFLTTKWLPLFWRDASRPALFILCFSFFVPLKKIKISSRALLLMSMFVLLAPVGLIIKQTPDPYYWYTFPFVNGLLAVGGLGLLYVYQRLPQKAQNIQNKWRLAWWLPVVAFALFPSLHSVVASNMLQKQARKGLNCRKEIRGVKAFLDQKALEGNFILTDAAVPFDRAFFHKQIDSTWTPTLSILKEEKYNYVVINREFAKPHLIDNNPKVTYTNDRAATTEFYRTYIGKSSVSDSHGNRWTKIYEDNCNLEIWEKNKI